MVVFHLTSKLSLTGICMWPSWGLTLIKLMSFLNTTSLRRAITKSYGFGTCNATNHCTTKSDRGTLSRKESPHNLELWCPGEKRGSGNDWWHLRWKRAPRVTRYYACLFLTAQAHRQGKTFDTEQSASPLPQGQAAKRAPSLLRAPDIQLQPASAHMQCTRLFKL